MGDRCNVWITTTENASEGIALYSHWGGHDMPESVRQAIEFGKGRWNDDTYLTRIIVSQLTKSDADGETGSGLSPKIKTAGDGYPVTIIALDTKTVHFASEGKERVQTRWSPGLGFASYIATGPRSYPNEETEATNARIAELEAELARLRG